MDSVTATFLGVIVASVLSPVVLMWLTGRQRRRDKQLDWAREDAVAERALAASVDNTRLLQEQNALVAGQSAVLGQVHALVNSNMTKAIEGEEVALSLLLAYQEKGDNVGADITRARLGILRSQLEDRAAATKRADDLAEGGKT